MVSALYVVWHCPVFRAKCNNVKCNSPNAIHVEFQQNENLALKKWGGRIRREHVQERKRIRGPLLVSVPALRDAHNIKNLAKGRWGDTAYLLGGWSGKRKEGSLDKWTPNLKMVNATIRFAEATERLDNNRWKHREEEDRASDRQDGDSEESDEGGEGRERRIAFREGRKDRLGTAANFSVSA